MLKAILKLFLLALIIIGGWIGHRWFTQPSLIAPLPYQVHTEYGISLDLAEAAHVLIIGDRLGYGLKRHTGELIKKLSLKLKEPLRVVNWAEEHEGLHRTLHKIKALKKFPPIILYLGASEEFYEERFFVKDAKKILANVKKFHQEDLASILYTLPASSRFIYEPLDFFQLGSEIKKDPGELISADQQKKMELYFNLFEVELEEMISYIKGNNSYLVLSTTPINIEIRPKKVCQNSTTESLTSYQEKIAGELKKGNHKSVLSEARDLSEVTISNAQSFYLLGMAALGSGQIEAAGQALSKATAYDCGNWRGHPVFNAIIKKKVISQGLKLIDFNNIVNRHLGQNELFVDEFIPQEIYYNHYLDEVYDTIKTKLKL